MAQYRIAWLPGDGVGREVMEATRIVLDALKLSATYIHGDIGWEYWCAEGDALPKRTLDLLSASHAAMFGAITSKPGKDAEAELVPALRGTGLTYRSPIVRMRQLFDLYVCLRPCKAYPGNPLNLKDGIDLVIFRENTEDLYAGVEFSPVPPELTEVLKKLSKPFLPFSALPGDQYAVSCKVNTRKGSERIVRAADGLFLEEARKVAAAYPEIRTDDANVDAICMWLLKNPFSYDVLVAPNLYGDVISDLAAQMVGGLGFGCSGNIGEKLAVFEPSHGSAPKYTGQYKVNPLATILAAKMMLDWLGEKEMGRRVEAAVAAVVKDGKVRTYDMGGTSTTLEMGEAVAGAL